MKVLVACEFSNTVRDAFLRLGHDAYSCDLQRADHPNPNWRRHIKGDVRPLLRESWDLVIAHPPCTYLANSGVCRFSDQSRFDKMVKACTFFLECLDVNSPRICIENPIQHPYAKERLPDYAQIIHPWQFGHAETKSTCLWLRGLPELIPTKIIDRPKSEDGWHKKTGGGTGKKRSITFQGIANAMAEQWGCFK